MKKVLFFLAIFACFAASSQTFFVGDTTCNYFKPNYTFTVASGATPYSSQTYYNISLNNNNNIVDISLGCDRVNYPPFPSQNPSWVDFLDFSIYSSGNIGANVQYVYAPGSPGSFGTSCGSILKNMAYGSYMSSTLNWSSTLTSAIYYDNYQTLPATQCGSHVDTFYVAFRKILSTNDTIFGWLLLDSHIPSKLISYAYRYNSLIPASFSIGQDSLCIGDSLDLNQTGIGYFNGIAVKNNIFHPSNIGNYQVYTSNGCINTSTLNITVLPLPSPPIISTFTNVCYGDSLTLIGVPSGGVFIGSGVIGDTLYSSIVSTNSISINYAVTDQYGCSNNSSTIFSIKPLTYTMSTCVGTTFSLPIELSLDTVFTGNGVFDGYNFDSNVSGTGITPILFTSTCNKTATLNITVYPNPPQPHIICTTTTCCIGDKISVTGLPFGGYFNAVTSQIVGVSDDTLYTEYFQPDILFSDSNRVIFSYDFYDNNGCGSQAYDTIFVEYSYSPNSPISSCPNTTFSLTGYPTGGAFSGTSIIGNTYTAPSSIGYDYGYYNYIYPSGCNATFTLNLFTYDCVGIEEQVNNESKILIYPNPSTDYVSIEIDNLNTTKEYSGSIVSADGKCLRFLKLQGNQNQINVSDLAKGIYFIEINIENANYRNKLVIIR